jgi:hypothetical protein
MKLLPLLVIGGIGLALYKASSAQAQPVIGPTPRSTTNPSLAGITIPAGLRLTSSDVTSLRALLKGTDAQAAILDIYGADTSSARLSFVQLVVNRMAQDHVSASTATESILREFYS